MLQNNAGFESGDRNAEARQEAIKQIERKRKFREPCLRLRREADGECFGRPEDAANDSGLGRFGIESKIG